MNRLKGGVDHSVKYRLKALESNPFYPELRERVDVTIKISASQYLLDISSLDDDKYNKNRIRFLHVIGFYCLDFKIICEVPHF